MAVFANWKKVPQWYFCVISILCSPIISHMGNHYLDISWSRGNPLNHPNFFMMHGPLLKSSTWCYPPIFSHGKPAFFLRRKTQRPWPSPRSRTLTASWVHMLPGRQPFFKGVHSIFGLQNGWFTMGLIGILLRFYRIFWDFIGVHSHGGYLKMAGLSQESRNGCWFAGTPISGNLHKIHKFLFVGLVSPREYNMNSFKFRKDS